jgi:hypothetical protein
LAISKNSNVISEGETDFLVSFPDNVGEGINSCWV